MFGPLELLKKKRVTVAPNYGSVLVEEVLDQRSPVVVSLAARRIKPVIADNFVYVGFLVVAAQRDNVKSERDAGLFFEVFDVVEQCFEGFATELAFAPGVAESVDEA
jgi:DNA phosphorothioation-dependent restriction protein DptG